MYRATLNALAQYGPRRTGVTHIARLARCNRSYLYRNWASPQTLIREATLTELRRLLDVACQPPGTLPPPPCLSVLVVVRAARLLREHPVVGAMARREPELAFAAVLNPNSIWHRTAWHWLCTHVTARIPRGAEQDMATLTVLTTALPYALTPLPDAADPAAWRASVARRVSLALHAGLGLPPACPDCTHGPDAGEPAPGVISPVS